MRTHRVQAEAFSQVHVEGLLPINEAGDAAHTLRLDHPLGGQGRLAGRRLAKHFDHATERQAAVVPAGQRIVQRLIAGIDELRNSLSLVVCTEGFVQVSHQFGDAHYLLLKGRVNSSRVVRMLRKASSSQTVANLSGSSVPDTRRT
ncbi:hypothetical protein D9M69_502310 [compost metagenome]